MDNLALAIVFPGQGSQKAGMGKDFHDDSALAADTYREASDVLGYDVASLCFEENERLDLTEYSQPCILATEIAMYRVIADRWGLQPSFFGGHSLGEYTALVAAGALPFAVALLTVQARGRLMQKATPVGMGGMAAVIRDNIDRDELAEIIKDLPVDLANVNSSKQVVISGEKKGLDEADRRLTEAWNEGGYRFVPLTVSAPFHSRFMKDIEAPFRNVLEEIKDSLQSREASRVTSNFTGTFHEPDSDSLVDRLVSQLSGTVRWMDNMVAIADSADEILEIGPGRPLRDFFKTIDVACTSITTLAAAERTFRDRS